MELRLLRYFLAVARENSFTRAARYLHVTQPTLSRQMMDLEEELGQKLLNRDSHNITLTPKACSCGNAPKKSWQWSGNRSGVQLNRGKCRRRSLHRRRRKPRHGTHCRHHRRTARELSRHSIPPLYRSGKRCHGTTRQRSAGFRGSASTSGYRPL